MPLTLTGSARWFGGPVELDACKVRLEDIRRRVSLGQLSEADADAERLTLLARPRASAAVRAPKEDTAQTWMVAAAIFLLVSGVGAAANYVMPSTTVASGHAAAMAGDNEDVLGPLKSYTSSLTSGHGSTVPGGTTVGQAMPDLNAMISRLAARLEKEPNDVEGWRLLGHSYFHTEQYTQAVSAFGRAIELDPASAELKQVYEEAKAKVSAGAVAAR